MRPPIAAVPAAGALLAVAAIGTPILVHGRDPDVVNLAAGLVLLVAGGQLTAVRQTRRTGTLLVVASMTWYLPDLASDVPIVGGLLAATSLAHVVPLVAAVLIAPEGRLVRRVDTAVVLVAAVAAVSAVTGGYQVLVPATGVALLLAGSTGTGARRRTGRAALAHRVAVLATTLALAGVPLARAWLGRGHEDWLFAAYAGLLSLTAVALVEVGPWLRTTAALDVGPDALATLDDLLAEATGDPRAHVLVRMGEGRWVRLDGSPASPPYDTTDPVLAVAKKPVLPPLADAITEGLRLAADNVRTRQVLDERVRELVALRSRLVRVEDDERVALVDRLRSGPLTALVALRAALRAGGAPAGLLEQVRETERDLERVASGLDPLDGSASTVEAIRLLAGQLDASVDVPVDVVFDDSAGRVLWYACSEALTNSGKHAPGAVRRVSLFVDGDQVVLVVSDDGPGPGPARRGGLVGVRDRVSAIGGTVTVTELHPGTRVEVRSPATRQHLARSGATTDVPDGRRLLASTPLTEEAHP